MVAFVHLGAVGILATVEGLPWVRFGLVILVAVSGYLNYQHLWRLRGRRTVTRLEWNTRDEWSVSFAGTETWQPARLLSATVYPWLVVLALRSETGMRVAVVLSRDAVDRETFRRLRGRLRLGVRSAG